MTGQKIARKWMDFTTWLRVGRVTQALKATRGRDVYKDRINKIEKNGT